MHNQSNNSNSNKYPLTMNQDFINHLTGMVYRAQESSTDASRQFGAQNAATSHLNQRNLSYPWDGSTSSSTNAGLFLLDNGLPIQQHSDSPQGNNNIRNNGTLSSTTVRSLNNSNFPNLNMNKHRQQRNNVGIQHSTAFLAGRSYVNTIKKFSEKSTFSMSNKDFPELPHSTNNSVETTDTNNHQGITKSPDSMKTMLTTENAKQFIGKNDESRPNITNLESANVTDQESGANNQRSYVTFIKAGTTPQAQSYNSLNNQAIKPKIEVNTFLPDEKIINIPAGVIHDQFGLLGQLIAMKLANTDPNLVYLNFGEDLTSLGLNLNSPENILPKFAGPFFNSDLQPHDANPAPDFKILDEYTNNLKICHSLPKFKLTLYKEDLLFYLFYTQVQSDIQIKVGRELYSRDWRYHTEYRVWITRAAGMDIIKKTDLFEHGTYYVFDVKLWRKVARQLFIEYSKLEHIDERIVEDDYDEASSNTIVDRKWIQNLGTGNDEF